MKWFKHISDSLDDPFVSDLMDVYGADGYLVFFGVLEIYSREFKVEDNWKLNVTQSYLTRKLHKRQSTLVIKILKHIQNSGKWEIDFNDDKVSVYIPKFTELIDEWSKRKLVSHSVVTPKILNTDKEADKDKELDKDIKANKGKKESPFEDEKITEELSKLTTDILNLYPKFLIHKFFQTFKNKNPKAIIHTFNRLVEQTKKTGKVDSPWAYCEKIITLENLNYNEADYISKSAEFKQPLDIANWAKNFGGGK